MPSALRELIYLTPEQREILASYMPAEARWHHLPNPAGPKPAMRVAAEENEQFLFVGRLSPEKGGSLAARAAKQAGVKVAFAGAGECEAEILAANPDAKMLGWLSPDDVAKEMRKSRALIFPSLWYETYGLVVADAIRAGLPVLVSRESVAASLVEHGRSGEHVSAGDVRQWGEAMKRLSSDEMVSRFSKAAFDSGSRLPDVDECTDRLINIYQMVLERQASPSMLQWSAQ